MAPPVARERILDTAFRLFYAHGIRAVGVDRIIAESGVAKATFYKWFPAKDDLVVAYLDKVDGIWSGQLHDAAEAAGPDPADELVGLFDALGAACRREGYRGCAFINAASEFQDPDGPIMRGVLAHRAWFYALVRDAFATAGHPDPDQAAGHYIMLRDGATTAGHLGDPAQARDTFDRGVAGLLRFTDDPAETDNASVDPPNSEAA